MNLNALVMLAGVVVAAIGVFLPWAAAGPFEVSGTDGPDGTIALVLYAIVGLCAVGGLRGQPKTSLRILGWLFIALSTLFAVFKMTSIESPATPKIGVYVMPVGCAIMLVGSFLKGKIGGASGETDGGGNSASA